MSILSKKQTQIVYITLRKNRDLYSGRKNINIKLTDKNDTTIQYSDYKIESDYYVLKNVNKNTSYDLEIRENSEVISRSTVETNGREEFHQTVELGTNQSGLSWYNFSDSFKNLGVGVKIFVVIFTSVIAILANISQFTGWNLQNFWKVHKELVAKELNNTSLQSKCVRDNLDNFLECLESEILSSNREQNLKNEMVSGIKNVRIFKNLEKKENITSNSFEETKEKIKGLDTSNKTEEERQIIESIKKDEFSKDLEFVLMSVWDTKTPYVLTSINRAGEAATGITFNTADLRGENGDNWSQGKPYIPTFSSGENVYYRRNDLATNVAVAPGMEVQMNVHFLNVAGHSANVGVTHLFLSTPTPDTAGQDATRLIQPGTNSRTVKLGSAWYNSNQNGAAPLTARDRYGKFVTTDPNDNINMANNDQANRNKMFTFKMIQPIVQTKKQEITTTLNANNEVIAEIKTFLKNNSVYNFAGSDVQVKTQNPKTQEALSQNVDITAGQEKTVVTTLNLGNKDSAPTQIATGQIRFNKSITEVVVPQTDAYSEYGRSVVIKTEVPELYGKDKWVDGLSFAMKETSMYLTLIPYQINLSTLSFSL